MVIKGDIRIFPDEVTASKAEKDLEQCDSLIPAVDAAKLVAIADSQRFSKDTRVAILKSASQIGYPPFL